MSAASAIGIDLGGTWLRVATGEDDGRIADVVRQPAPTTREELRAAVLAAVDQLDDSGDVVVAGCAVAGLAADRRCEWVPNLPFLDGCDLGELFAGTRVATTVAANDAHLSLLAERVLGAASGVDNAVLLAIGTGIGSAVLADGRIVRGAEGAACSFGWASADLADPGDERSGWLERHAAGRALDELATAHGHAEGSALTAAARAGDELATGAVDGVGAVLGTALAGVVGLLAPGVIVVTGGVGAAGDVLFPPLRSALDRALPAHLRAVPVLTGQLGADAALTGALLAARRPTWWEVAR